MNLKRTIVSFCAVASLSPFAAFAVSNQISEVSTAGAEEVEVDGDLVVLGNSDATSASLEVTGAALVDELSVLDGELSVLNSTGTTIRFKVEDSGVIWANGNSNSFDVINDYPEGAGFMFLPNHAGAFRAQLPIILSGRDTYEFLSVGLGSVGFGTLNIASGQFSMVHGVASTASGDFSTAWGNGTEASGFHSTAWGHSSQASGVSSTAWGLQSSAQSLLSTAFGSYNIGAYTFFDDGNDSNDGDTTWYATDPLLEVGNSDDANLKSNALTILKNGKTAIGTHTAIPTAEETLTVYGPLTVGDYSAGTPVSPALGAIRFIGNDFKGYTNNGWQSLIGGPGTSASSLVNSTGTEILSVDSNDDVKIDGGMLSVSESDGSVSREVLFDGSVDSVNGSIKLLNGTTWNGRFFPTLMGDNQSDNRSSIAIFGRTLDTLDTRDANSGAIHLGASLHDGDPLHGNFSPLVNRRVLVVKNHWDLLFGIEANGNVGIGVDLPVQQLEIDGAIALGTTTTDTLGAIRYEGGDFEGYKNATDQWVSLTASGSTGPSTQVVSADDNALVAIETEGSTVETLSTTLTGKVLLAEAQGDISMGAFAPVPSNTVTYQSDFSIDADGWTPTSGTTLSVSGGVLSATDTTISFFQQSGVFSGGSIPHRITAVFSGSTDVRIQSWHIGNQAYQTIYSGWDGIEPIEVTPYSTNLRFRTNSPTFQLTSIKIEEVN